MSLYTTYDLSQRRKIHGSKPKVVIHMNQWMDSVILRMNKWQIKSANQNELRKVYFDESRKYNE